VRGVGVTAKTQYAVQAVIYLARQEPLTVAPVSAIAAAIEISPKFLEDILAALRSAGIVQSRRGKDGGYLLTRPPAELTLLEVVQALEGPLDSPARESGSPAARVTENAFEQAAHAALARLAALTFDHLVEETRRFEAEPAPSYMYHL
jgi:Rrf2 family protein